MRLATYHTCGGQSSTSTACPPQEQNSLSRRASACAVSNSPHPLNRRRIALPARSRPSVGSPTGLVYLGDVCPSRGYFLLGSSGSAEAPDQRRGFSGVRWSRRVLLLRCCRFWTGLRLSLTTTRIESSLKNLGEKLGVRTRTRIPTRFCPVGELSKKLNRSREAEPRRRKSLRRHTQRYQSSACLCRSLRDLDHVHR